MRQAMASALCSLHASTKRRYELACNALKFPLTEDQLIEYESVKDELKKRMDELETKIHECKKND